MATWRIGTTTIHKVLEAEVPVPVVGALRTDDTALLKRYPWPAPDYSRADGTFVLSVHGLVVDTGTRRILVDTCVGNARASVPFLQMLDTTWLDDLTALGYPPESIDTVVCTHLHFDHIGWNTRLVAGKWVPTFPRARHLVTRVEWDHWADEADTNLPDTMQPLIDEGLVDFVGADHQVCDGVRLEAAPGHTPGQVAVVVESGGERAVITGDLVHHPVQFIEPDVAGLADTDVVQAAATRRAFVERYADTGTLVIGTHFPAPTAGLLRRGGDGTVRFVADGLR
ncbi:MBL fold metallo-hydrolase [Streptomyces sp. NBC_01408]|uniref:MBL fold metallo-hydrolase n=1 Tax=Streptomyces sp. NBC_01408 TaxID=2903855 RepID=UPI00224E0C60|nr:MBL fold metallo-hydrolase [Streptomyces sp. NBC_01408]MCX4695490.1 MBL fold metallo-hydrolase [Streptomyces sp. NBC_01408]